jgi:hypothetical protein
VWLPVRQTIPEPRCTLQVATPGTYSPLLKASTRHDYYKSAFLIFQLGLAVFLTRRGKALSIFFFLLVRPKWQTTTALRYTTDSYCYATLPTTTALHYPTCTRVDRRACMLQVGPWHPTAVLSRVASFHTALAGSYHTDSHRTRDRTLDLNPRVHSPVLRCTAWATALQQTGPSLTDNPGLLRVGVFQAVL